MSDTSHSSCVSCRQSKTHHSCGLCGGGVCRSCAIFLDEATFAFRGEVHPDLKHSYYCPQCHDSRVAPEIETYQETLERARSVYFFFGTSRHPLPILKKAKSEVKVDQCVDRDETILRLGFLAAEAGFNAIVEAEVGFEKKRNHGFEKKQWTGRGTPAEVDAERLERGRH